MENELWSVYGASIVGPYHVKKGEGSQDYANYIIKDDITIIAVADGAGSKSRSLEGAELVVEKSLDFLEQTIESKEISEEVIYETIYYSRNVLLEQEDYKEMGCTLSLVVLTNEEWFAGVVGDAFAVIHETENSHIFVQPQSDFEFANITELMTNKIINPLVVSGGSVIGASVSSDGLLNSTIENGTPTDRVWSPLVRRALDRSLNMQDFLRFMESKQIIDDDTTVVMAVRG